MDIYDFRILMAIISSVSQVLAFVLIAIGGVIIARQVEKTNAKVDRVIDYLLQLEDGEKNDEVDE